MGPSPSKVGKYSIVGVLSRGASEEVYLGEYAGRRVAIRLFSSAGPEKERLVEEARKIAGLSHANIAFQEVGVHEDQPFLVAEMSGTNLETWLGADPSLADQLGVIEGICAGITYAHEHGVLHRMLTTGSVLVTPDGEARIWNFGLSKLKPETGVLAYVAPEIIEGQPATQQSDIFSAGLVCYEILTGIAPKPGDQGVAKAIRDVKSETPRDLSDAVMACRERAPDWRPKDLSYLLEVVRKLRGSAGPKTPRPVAAAPVARAATPSPRGRAAEKGGPPIAVIAIGAGLLIGGGAFFFLRGDKAAPVAQNAPTTTAPTTTLVAVPDTTLAAMPAGAATARPTPVPTPVPTTLAGRPTPTPPPATIATPTATPAAGAARPTPPPATAPPATTLPPATTTLPPATTLAAAASTTGPTTQAHGVPLLRALSPPMLKRGQTMLVDVRGSDLFPQLVPTLLKAKGGVAAGLRVARQRFVNDTTIQVFIEVAADAAPGQYAIVLSDGGSSTNTLRIDVAK